MGLYFGFYHSSVHQNLKHQIVKSLEILYSSVEENQILS